MSEENVRVTFEDLGIEPRIVQALHQKGFESPTPIQLQTIPLLLKNKVNVIGKAQTGTGKTAAFGVPIIQNITEKKDFIQALILTPTRELTLQVCEELNTFGGVPDLRIIPVFGGQPIPIQLRNLDKGADIVVGTPGRVIDLIERKRLKLDSVSYFVLDEADEMLNMGFIDDIKKIMGFMPEEKRILCFSATMPKPIIGIARKYMGVYEMVSVDPVEQSLELTKQISYEVPEELKFETLCRVIDSDPNFYGLVFCSRKDTSDTVGMKLEERGYEAEVIHGDILQEQRTRIMERFKKRKIKILVATDVAARGIDIYELTHVVNYDIPQDPESYTHRIGRTGRAGKTGTAVTIYTPKEFRKFSFIKKASNADVQKSKVPDANLVFEMKRQKLLNMLVKKKSDDFYNSKQGKPYAEFVRELMNATDASAEEILAAFLKQVYASEIIPDKYDYAVDKKFERYYNSVRSGSVQKNDKDKKRDENSKKGKKENNKPKTEYKKTKKNINHNKTYAQRRLEHKKKVFD